MQNKFSPFALYRALANPLTAFEIPATARWRCNLPGNCCLLEPFDTPSLLARWRSWRCYWCNPGGDNIIVPILLVWCLGVFSCILFHFRLFYCIPSFYSLWTSILYHILPLISLSFHLAAYPVLFCFVYNKLSCKGHYERMHACTTPSLHLVRGRSIQWYVIHSVSSRKIFLPNYQMLHRKRYTVCIIDL